MTYELRLDPATRTQHIHDLTTGKAHCGFCISKTIPPLPEWKCCEECYEEYGRSRRVD